MTRREFIALLSSAAAGTAVMAPRSRAQQQSLPTIGYLYAGSPEPSAPLLSAFLEGLRETGYSEGQNVTIEYRWARNDNQRLPELAADLAQRRVSVIAALASPAAIQAAKRATTTIPIVFSLGSDPVQLGLVESLNRPGRNLTGVTSLNVELGAKRLEFLSELVPSARRYGVLLNPDNQSALSNVDELRTAASVLGREIEIVKARTPDELVNVFGSVGQRNTDALLVYPGTPFNESREKLVALVAAHAVPAIYASRQFPVAGGLISYGAVLTEEFRLAGNYTGRILRGDEPAEMPVMRAAKFELVINLRTAGALGLTIPPTLLARADEVIE